MVGLVLFYRRSGSDCVCDFAGTGVTRPEIR